MHADRDLGQELAQLIHSIYPLPAASVRQVTDLATEIPFSKDELIFEINQPNDREYFLLEGVCISFLLDESGREHVLSFFQAPAVVTPHVVRTERQVSLLNLKALTPVRLAALSAPEFEALLEHDLNIRAFANHVLRRELQVKVKKEIGLAALGAIERLAQFRVQFPGLENIVPHPYIASYLGITPVSLSRLRQQRS